MTRPDPGAPRADERMEAYRAGTMSPDERAAFEEEILTDDARAEELYADLALEDALEEAAGGKVVPIGARRRPARWLALALPLAAAVAFLVWWAPSGRDAGPGDTPVFRGDAALTPREPVGDVTASPAVFSWTPREGAHAYRLEVVDADGARVWTARVDGPRAEVPVGALAGLGAGEGLWKVAALDEHGIVIAESPPVRFRIVGPAGDSR